MRPYIRVCPSVGSSIGPSVRNPFFPNERKRVFSTFEIARGRGWRGERIGSDEGAGKGAREGMTSRDASDGRVSGLVTLFLCLRRELSSPFWLVSHPNRCTAYSVRLHVFLCHDVFL